MTDREPGAGRATIAHRASHRRLLQTVGTGPDRDVDAVVVPAWRPTHHLTTAAELAWRLGCPLVALCSGGARPREFAVLASEWPGLHWCTVEIPDGYEHPLLRFGSSAADVRPGDLSSKRNVGLLLARMLGWRTVLFLDDDIFDIGPGMVRRAASGLDRLDAVSFPVTDWPDNSVVCHARRVARLGQDVFASGSALLVDTSGRPAHFPAVYNEDWLFLAGSLALGRVGTLGTVRQLRYDPFADPERAATEEFGEVVAEGLVGILHTGRSITEVLRPSYWEDVLGGRAEVIAGTTTLVTASDDRRAPAAIAALDAAEARRSSISADSCAAFIRSWRDDDRTWGERWRSVESAPSLSAAGARLDLDVVSADRSTNGDTAPASRGRRRVARRPVASPVSGMMHRAPRPQGIAILVPGFLDSMNYYSARAMARALQQAGLTTVRFDPRGSWTTEGPPDEYTVTRQVADIGALLAEHAPLAGGRRVLVGYCYGGFVAAATARANPRITDVVAIAPTRSFIWSRPYDPARDTWRTAGERAFSRVELDGSERPQIRVPYSVVEDACRYGDEVWRDLRVPTLVVSGECDEVVPPGDVRAVHDLCGSPSKELALLPAVGHDYRDDVGQTAAVTGAVCRWLRGDSALGG